MTYTTFIITGTYILTSLILSIFGDLMSGILFFSVVKDDPMILIAFSKLSLPIDRIPVDTGQRINVDAESDFFSP